jgi:SAM-dependent methyltransferase
MTEHLGGFVPKDEAHPHGDPWTWTPLLWDFLLEELRPATMIDLGCGEGHAAQYFLERGVEVLGVDGSTVAQHGTMLPAHRFLLYDLTLAPLPLARVDLVWCCEMVEHVETRYLDNVLQALSLGKYVAMTHAEPGQGGHHHVNCQPMAYWVGKLREAGLVLDWPLSLGSRVLTSPEAHWTRSGLIFKQVL